MEGVDDNVRKPGNNNGKKNSGKDPNKIEGSSAEGKQKMNSSKIKLQKCYNVKEKPNNLNQVQMEY